MCNLYDVGPSPNSERFRWEAEVRRAVGDLTYVAPGKTGVVARREKDEIRATQMRWGFRRKFKNTAGNLVAKYVNNARDDKLTGRMWGKSFRERRCIIPMRHFFEYTGPEGRKTKHRVRTAGSGDMWFWAAGIWEESSDKEVGLCYSMLMTEANDEMEPFHHRMPAILLPESIEEYFESTDPPYHLVTPFPGELDFDPPIPALAE